MFTTASFLDSYKEVVVKAEVDGHTGYISMSLFQ